MSDPLLDLALGQFAPGEAEALRARAQADPATREGLARTERWVAALDRAYDPGLDPRAGERIAARVVTRVRDEEARAARRTPAAGRRVFWWRLLAASVAAHAAVLALLAWGRQSPPARPVDPFVAVAWDDAARDLATAPSAPEDAGPVVLPDVAPPSLADLGTPVESLFAPDDAGTGMDVAPPAPSGLAATLPAARGAFRARTDDATKRWIEARVGVEGSLDAIRRSLEALARSQAADGSFPAADGASASGATALAVLPFLGDGSCSRFGPHRAVVERAIGFLRGRRASDGRVAGDAYVLWALSEDALLARAFLTPVEGRERAAEVLGLAERLGDDEVARRDPALARGLAVAAQARVLAAGAVPVRSPADAAADTSSWAAGDALLRARDAAAFRTWARRAHDALRRQTAEDGLVRGEGADAASRVADTARALLALQVPFRGS